MTPLKTLLLVTSMLVTGSAIAANDPQALGAPGLIPHDVSSFLPITIDKNMCIACHSQQAKPGTTKVAGQPVGTPADHFDASGKISGLRYDCMLCHAPQNKKVPELPVEKLP